MTDAPNRTLLAVLLVAVVAVAAVGAATPATPTDRQAPETTPTATAGGDAPGAAFADAVRDRGVAVRGEFRARSLDRRLAGADTAAERARILDDALSSVAARRAALRERRASLRERYEAGELSRAAVRVRVASVDAALRESRPVVERARRATDRLPNEVVEAYDLDETLSELDATATTPTRDTPTPFEVDTPTLETPTPYEFDTPTPYEYETPTATNETLRRLLDHYRELADSFESADSGTRACADAPLADADAALDRANESDGDAFEAALSDAESSLTDAAACFESTPTPTGTPTDYSK